ncbi:MAG TPA: TetR/AcrR family transcriptional regulator [Flavobacteriales bacterium]|jgi:AcrR family transcriptional regulator|nr:TetR/AcrR family transcriptional regulator [Flavobacteriales bacterium]HNA32233.1 TetR/AcrR family transcriptional regulator [Flavobacteriales bacterium]HNI04414.1 TetR/AcrR family transcriptional regulator [Flavobacteriales bacterium]HNK69891.1 TetR/AcrR family transcriptional regulator [Flavobacteriales bacterium]HNM69438.1 TetR/AcrR family transcriptional regulator [Flavobacteriales bacterium]
MAPGKNIPHPASALAPVDDRWERIVDGACRIFWKLGIKSVTMDDVATRLGISKKTLYQYVTCKDDLVGRVLKHQEQSYQCDIEAVRSVEKQNAIDELYAITTKVAAHLKDMHPSVHFDLEKYHPEAFRTLVTKRRTAIFRNMSDNLERGIREGLYREDLNVPMIATIYLARFDLMFEGKLVPPATFNVEDLHWEIFRYHVRGIASRKGLDHLEKKMNKEHGTR